MVTPGETEKKTLERRDKKVATHKRSTNKDLALYSVRCEHNRGTPLTINQCTVKVRRDQRRKM